MEPPTVAELQANSVVQAAFAAAWADSFPDDPSLRHEEGGFLYMDPGTGAVVVRRAMSGHRRELDLSRVPEVKGRFLVATYHTHPNPMAAGWDPEPSPDDRREAELSGVPWIVISELGVFSVGPERRIGGFSGTHGYPL